VLATVVPGQSRRSSSFCMSDQFGAELPRRVARPSL
jgi:hypothetical protein